MRRPLVWIWVLAWNGYAVLTLDARAVGGPVGVPIESAWLETDTDGVTRLYVDPNVALGPGGCGERYVLDVKARRQAIGLRVVAVPPPPSPYGPGDSCGLSLTSARLDAPVAGRRVWDLVAGTELTSRGPLAHVVLEEVRRDGSPRAR